MGAIDQEFERSPRYYEMKKAAAKFNERNYCSVVAIALSCEVSFEKARTALKEAGRRDRCGAKDEVIIKAIDALGFKLLNFDTQKVIDKYPKPHYDLQNVTTHHPIRFPQHWAKHAGENLLFFSYKHVCNYSNGRVHDWTEGRSMLVKYAKRVVAKVQKTKATVNKNRVSAR